VHKWQARGLILLLTLVEHREHCAGASGKKREKNQHKYSITRIAVVRILTFPKAIFLNIKFVKS
jgi:hypothetical protein